MIYADTFSQGKVKPLEARLHHTIPERETKMRNTNTGFTIVDFLIIVAILLIVLGMFGPHVSKYVNKSKPDSNRAAVVHPVR